MYKFAMNNPYLVLGIGALIMLVIVCGVFFGLSLYLEKKDEEKKNGHNK